MNARRIAIALGLVNQRNLTKALAAIKNGRRSSILSSFRNLIAYQEASEGLESAVQWDSYAPFCHPHPTPLVTVVIPCFNYGNHVGEAVASVLAQTFRGLEIVVVDGGSTDGSTPDRVKALEGPRVRVVLREGRHLAGDNRNFGILQSQSPYIVCLDADDMLHPTYVEKALFMAEHLGFDVVSTALRMFGARADKVGILPRPSLSDMMHGNHMSTCALFRRELWQQVGGFRDFGLGADHAAEDWDFWMRLSAKGARFGNIWGECLLNYRVHHTHSLSSGPGVPELAVQRRRILERNADLLSKKAIERSEAARGQNFQVSTPETSLAVAMTIDHDDESQPSILIAMPYFLIGGAERLLSHVTRELKSKGWRIVLVSTMFQGDDDTDSIEWFETLTTEVYALPRFLSPSQWINFVEYLFASRRFDALLIAGSAFFYDILLDLKKKYPGLAVVDFLFNTSGHVISHRKAFPLLSGVLCENLEVRDWCLQMGWDANRVALVESGIDVSAYATGPRPADLCQQMNICPEEIVVGFSGRLSEEKAPETFVEIARLCRNEPRLRFVMTGGGPLSKFITQIVATNPPGTRLEYRGVVDEVKPYFTLYDIFVLPSYIDGRPIAILEALASGCAIVASSIGGLPALVEEGVNGYLVRPGDARSSAARLLALAADPALLQQFKCKSRSIAEEKYDLRNTDAPYARAITELMARARAMASEKP
ncbi:glycosyltransferase [Pelagibacterium montanilacus]|uniref:glycosyltransferase n=1 Tax=Pelagibacterium montanilacus TaxID=2185280 RepID=UPI000F8F803D|nr:glycosyltransferase [Pelagibacterium montanilacus]